MYEEKIDILVATYNSNIFYLKMQLDSLLNQTYKNINIIISDDASTKNELKIFLKEYAKKDERVELFLNEKNVGYVKNFEFLLKKSKAEYIMFCDHDDVWYKEKVEKSYNKLVNENVDLVYCDARQIDKNGNILHESYINYKHMPKLDGNNNILTFSRHVAIGCSQIFTKRIKDELLPFKGGIMAHDWITVYLASVGNGISYIDEPLFGYRIHSENEFGGRDLNNNLQRWKNEHGNTIKSYYKYREWAIRDTYYKGAIMCHEYTNCGKDNEIIKYYENVLKSKLINLHVIKYFKYLSYKGIGNRAIKELVLFHLPILGYFRFRFN